jgi:hypothetical protein
MTQLRGQVGPCVERAAAEGSARRDVHGLIRGGGHGAVTRAAWSQRALVAASLLGCAVSRTDSAQRGLVIASLLRPRSDEGLEGTGTPS